MPRLDVRIRTNLEAKAVYFCRSEKLEERVRIKELSLSSALLTGLTKEPENSFTISITLPLQGDTELVAEPVKVRHGQVAVRLYYPRKTAISALWEHLREAIVAREGCPYCGQNSGKTGETCAKCGSILDFRDPSYLDKHLQTTFMERVRNRLSRLDAEFIQRIISFIDAELLDRHVDDHEEEFVGTAPKLLEVFSMIRKAAGTDMNILVLGESGTGKELTAKAIHEKSNRKEKPFVAVNCAAIPEGLLEAELFGYEKGAFTGAYAMKKGRFELADGGSIFLDEIGDLSPGLQAKLLRFLEDRTIERIGGKAGKKVDVRIIAATNCDLNGMVEKATFRTDLFFRLNSFTIKLPPLRERGEDKIILAKYFFKKIGRTERTRLKGFSEDAIKAIREYSWPGNVRELVNKVRRGLVMAAGESIEPADMELDHRQDPAEGSELLPDVHRQMVSEALAQNRFIIAHAAKALQISRPTLYTLIKKYEIDVPPRKGSYGL